MSNTPRNLTRNQLAEFLPNQRAVRAFEQLLKQVGDLLPSDLATINRLIQEAAVAAGIADSRAQEAQDALSRIATALELLAAAPVSQPLLPPVDVTPPRQDGRLDQLGDVRAFTPTDGDKLIYNGTTHRWEKDSRSYLMLE